jgi:CDP-diacylglycerol pyrophosphatase
VLWRIVTTCIDIRAADYCTQCSSPRTDSPCAHGRGCKDTTEVWEETTDYVALRDVKMCGCEDDFVHGLAIPRSRVTGVEDSKRPNGIWDFAWGVAKKRIKEDAAIALAVNPQGQRSQNQLHVHIVRLALDARQCFAAAISARVRSLGDVWNVAAEKAALAGLKDYGVLVTKEPEDDFLVLIEGQSPEKAYTRWECR